MIQDSKLTRPIASPIMNTNVWSAIAPGEVRKKKARVMWNRESEVMIVAADMSAILMCGEFENECCVRRRL